MVLGNWEDAVRALPLAPFSELVLEFFNDLSKVLIKERVYSDVATFGFWCRKGSLMREKAKYIDIDTRLGRGVVFHSTPSNVPVNFAFSFAGGLLAGNANIVRLPGRDFEQVTIITDAIRRLVESDYSELAPYICFVKYPPDKEMHNLYSSLCDVRMIWGGDGTISELRDSPLKPRATELTFADRYSATVINADEYLKASDKSKIAQDFYNDTYFSDQNACTSPAIIFWMGQDIEVAKTTFWENVRLLAKEKYSLAPVSAVGKLHALYKAAVGTSNRLSDMEDNFVTRVNVENIDEQLMHMRYNSGFYFEHDISDLREIMPVCGEGLQTLTYFGLSKEELMSFIKECRPKGIDRAVPMGKSMDFSLVWDGYDLIYHLSRKVTII